MSDHCYYNLIFKISHNAKSECTKDNTYLLILVRKQYRNLYSKLTLYDTVKTECFHIMVLH